LNCADVAVARSVATIRRAAFHHVAIDGDAVARTLEAMVHVNGALIILLGGAHYDDLRRLTRASRVGSLVNAFVDASVAKIGLDAIATALFHREAGEGREGFLAQALGREMSLPFASERAAILQDISDELTRLRPGNDSVALLVRNFFIANRSLRRTVHQGIMCRRYLQVYYPFTDITLMEALFKLQPRHTAYRKLYLGLFRRHFPDYAELPYAASMLAPRRGSFWHGWSERYRGWKKYFTNTPSWESHWQSWANESRLLRAKVTALFREGWQRQDEWEDTLGRLALGPGLGDLVQLAALGSLARGSPRWGNGGGYPGTRGKSALSVGS